MPTSSLLVAPAVIHLVHTAEPHRTVLDVGAGWGKYATLLREYLNERPERIDAVEAWPPYVEEHQLGRLYDEVHTADVCDLGADVLGRYDVVLMVDVLEHLDLAAGLDLLTRIPGRVVVCTPLAFFSNGPGLPPTEEHRSHWTADLWNQLGQYRPVEERDKLHGAWLVRLGPLP